ncbi:thiamine pyrophosphate-binding protein [Emcibacter nanhaiensis]|uniref:Thiamine pyrophosphate-binding protein n=1 Tax=Emcibacter nanhaiensis TaxID=1505037 RepID=A0A501PSS9_9PROT|nr:thiamine pyrophosphate-binding protein [Emcibacter nanhaiensis]TPD63208.1 thiamine pyrophosphate-binding protein [Emcibacter nanhaiensis]
MPETDIPVYEALVTDIKNLGVECVFGLMSDDTAELVALIDAAGMRFYSARHENNAVSMAEGYAAATGRLGIALIGRGPATANSMNGINYANRTGSPVLVLYGDAANTGPQPNALGPDLKSLNSQAVLEAVGIKTFRASDGLTARSTFVQAAASALSRTTALLLPVNILQARVSPTDTVPEGIDPVLPAPQPARDSAVRSATSLLEKSRKPLIIAGAGAHAAGARDAIIKLADQIGAALVTSLKGKDMFRGHPFDCGILGSLSHAGGRWLIDQADCILAIGVGLNQMTTSYRQALPEGAPLIHVDNCRPHIGRWYDADVSLVGDARLVAEQLCDIIPARSQAEMEMRTKENSRWLAGFTLADDFEARHTEHTVDSRSLTLELVRLLPENRNVVWDSGNMLGNATYFSVPGPSHFKHTSDTASIGMGFGTAMGFAAGTPERTTVLAMGDGSFLMNQGELETVAREDIPLVIVIYNDCAYGAELHYLKEKNIPVNLTQFPDIDYAPIAEAYGFKAYTVRSLDDLRAIAPVLEKPEGQIFLDCKINAAVAAPFMLEIAELSRKK